MNINERIFKDALSNNREERRTNIARETSSVKPLKGSQVIEPLLANIQAQGNLKHFSFLALNNLTIQKQLAAEASNKEKFVELVLRLGKYYGCKFTDSEVRAIPGTWEAHDESELIEALLSFSKKGLEAFLTEAKRNSSLFEKLGALNFDSNFPELLVKLGNSLGYSFTIEEVKEASKNLLSETPEPPPPSKTYKMIGRIWA
jgi:Nif11 domain